MLEIDFVCSVTKFQYPACCAESCRLRVSFFFKLYVFILLTSTLVPGINYFLVTTQAGSGPRVNLTYLTYLTFLTRRKILRVTFQMSPVQSYVRANFLYAMR